MEEIFFMSVILNVLLGTLIAICVISKTGTRRCTDRQIKAIVKKHQEILKEFEKDTDLYQHKKVPSLETQFQNYLDLLDEQKKDSNL